MNINCLILDITSSLFSGNLCLSFGTALADRQFFWNSARRPAKTTFALKVRNIPFVKYAEYLGVLFYRNITWNPCRSQWPRGLRRRSAAARLLRSWVRIPPGAWMFVCWQCCVLSDRGLCDELITRPEESYRLWCVVVCDLETSKMRRP